MIGVIGGFGGNADVIISDGRNHENSNRDKCIR